MATRGGLWRTGSGRLVFGADTYFQVRVPHPEVNTDGHEELERSIITGHRWWTVAELRVTSEYINPPKTADLVAILIADGPPASPVRLPWRSGLRTRCHARDPHLASHKVTTSHRGPSSRACRLASPAGFSAFLLLSDAGWSMASSLPRPRPGRIRCR